MELHFLRPYWFLAVIPILFLCWRLNKKNLIDNWQLICDKHLLSHLLILPKNKLKLGIPLLLVSSFLAILALSGPSWEKKTQPIYRALLGNVLVLNLSPSMADTFGTAKKIEKARYKLLDYLERLKEGQTGLVVYTDEAHTISPLTEDSHTIANFIPVLDPSIMPTYNDDTAIGLMEGAKLLTQAELHQGNIILITDKITNFDSAKQLAESLSRQGYRLFIYSLSQKPSVVSQMKMLANLGRGKLIYWTPNNHDIEQLLANTKKHPMLPPPQKTTEKGLIWQDNGRIFVLLLLPLALLAFRRGYF
jgi:Ca-activated chloride channel homolog